MAAGARAANTVFDGGFLYGRFDVKRERGGAESDGVRKRLGELARSTTGFECSSKGLGQLLSSERHEWCSGCSTTVLLHRGAIGD